MNEGYEQGGGGKVEEVANAPRNSDVAVKFNDIEFTVPKGEHDSSEIVATNELMAPEKNKTGEKDPSLREIGRERIARVGSFFSNMKEGFRNKVSSAGEGLRSVANKAKEIGIAGVETVMATPEALKRGVEYSVGAYEKSKEACLTVRDKVVEVKNSVVEGGKNAIESGIQTLSDAKDSTIEFGNQALYRASERVSRPFMEFQTRRLLQSLQHVAGLVEKGKVNREEYNKLESLVNQMQGLRALAS